MSVVGTRVCVYEAEHVSRDLDYGHILQVKKART